MMLAARFTPVRACRSAAPLRQPSCVCHKIVGTEVFEDENSGNSGTLLRKALLREGCVNNPPIVHSDNGSAMKGSTLPATFEKLRVTPSYNSPRVSNDNAYIESVFGMAT